MQSLDKFGSSSRMNLLIEFSMIELIYQFGLCFFYKKNLSQNSKRNSSENMGKIYKNPKINMNSYADIIKLFSN